MDACLIIHDSKSYKYAWEPLTFAYLLKINTIIVAICMSENSTEEMLHEKISPMKEYITKMSYDSKKIIFVPVSTVSTKNAEKFIKEYDKEIFSWYTAPGLIEALKSIKKVRNKQNLPPRFMVSRKLSPTRVIEFVKHGFFKVHEWIDTALADFKMRIVSIKNRLNNQNISVARPEMEVEMELEYLEGKKPTRKNVSLERYGLMGPKLTCVKSVIARVVIRRYRTYRTKRGITSGFTAGVAFCGGKIECHIAPLKMLEASEEEDKTRYRNDRLNLNKPDAMPKNKLYYGATGLVRLTPLLRDICLEPIERVPDTNQTGRDIYNWMRHY